VAGESLIQAYCEGYGFEGYIFRFVSILGERYSHGHVFDFYRQLMEHPDRLTVLGDGTQRKSYLHVQDCIDAMLHVIELQTAAAAPHRVQVYNLGTDEYCKVKDSIGWITGFLGLEPQLHYTGGDRGWIGDNPFIFLDTRKIRSTGWKPRFPIEEGVQRTMAWLHANQWIYQARSEKDTPVHSKPATTGSL
jgi:UDP-glucose 4-epimerase